MAPLLPLAAIVAVHVATVRPLRSPLSMVLVRSQPTSLASRRRGRAVTAVVAVAEAPVPRT